MSRKAGLYFRWGTTIDTLHAYNRTGSPLDIDEPEGTLWRIKDRAGIENPHTSDASYLRGSLVCLY